MSIHQLYFEQSIPTDIQTLWDFISSPANLKKITPPELGFEITSSYLPEKMYPGMIISYKVSPLLGVKMNWVTEITHVDPGVYFVDEQRVGPYAMWHHEHRLKLIDGGVLMTDLISYRPPFGPLGSVVNALVIRSKLNEIFAYREQVLISIFGSFRGGEIN